MTSSSENSILLQYNNLQIPSSQVVLVYTEWNPEIINKLKEGVKKILHEFKQINVIEYCVPGAFEIPFAIAEINRTSQVDAYIALGCVIKGETPHFKFVCKSVTDGITQLNLTLQSPVIFGVLTVNNEEQAYERLGGQHGHKGEEAAIAALKMISFVNDLKNKS